MQYPFKIIDYFKIYIKHMYFHTGWVQEDTIYAIAIILSLSLIRSKTNIE